MQTIEKSKNAELVTLENRIEKAKEDLAALERQKELIQASIDAKTADYQAFIGGREKQIRDASDKLGQEQKKFEYQREEFKALLSVHQGDKESLAKERENFNREKARFEGKQKSVNEFVQAVRRAYNVLPD